MINIVSKAVKKHSKAQQYVMALYRNMLRASRGKDESIKIAIKEKFRLNSVIPTKNLLQIEFHVRQAEKNLDLLKDTNNVKSYQSNKQ